MRDFNMNDVYSNSGSCKLFEKNLFHYITNKFEIL